MLGYDYAEATILKLGSEALQARISPDERCGQCKGKGLITAARCLTHEMYEKCWKCGGYGRVAESPECVEPQHLGG